MGSGYTERLRHASPDHRQEQQQPHVGDNYAERLRHAMPDHRQEQQQPHLGDNYAERLRHAMPDHRQEQQPHLGDNYAERLRRMVGASRQEEQPPDPQDTIEITIVTALTGDVLATLVLSKAADVMTLKQEIAAATGVDVLMQQLLDQDSELCCEHDFMPLVSAVSSFKTADELTLRLVISEEEAKVRSTALPFHSNDREYLAEGGMESCLGQAFQTSCPWNHRGTV